jgi:hypothetical protein
MGVVYEAKQVSLGQHVALTSEKAAGRSTWVVVASPRG